MKLPEIQQSTLARIGLALTLGGLVWKFSARITSLEDGQAYTQQSLSAINEKLSILPPLQTDVAVIREKVERLERPVYHTRSDVSEIRKEVAQLNEGPSASFINGPLSKR